MTHMKKKSFKSVIKNKTSPQKEKGLLNLVSILAFLSIVKIIIDDYNEFGCLVKFPLSNLSSRDIYYFIIVLILNFLRNLGAYFHEQVNMRYPSKITNIALIEMIICYINIYKLKHVYLSGWSLIVGVICIAKLTSFHLSEGKKYNFRHFMYFLVSPTLVYKESYNKKEKINILKVLIRLLQMISGVFVFVFVADQFSVPSILRICEGVKYLEIVENAFHLAISTVLLFLIFFHLVFVCMLDIIAELTLYKNAEFYSEWWNTTTVAKFWSLWNIPVHKWFKEHIYKPMLVTGYSKLTSLLVCFFISAAAHEYVATFSSNKFSGWVFIGMMIQVPLIYVSDFIYKHLPGFSNLFFWCSFCVIGQPAIALLYYRSEYLKLQNQAAVS